MKKLIICILSCLALFSAPCSAASDIRVFINSTEVLFDTPPQMVNNRTMVPIRAICEALGMVVQWDDNARGALAFNDKRTLMLFEGENYINVNGEVRIIDTAPVIIDSRILVPVRAVAEATGCDVAWDAAASSVIITSENTADADAWEREVFDLTNKVRAENGLSALTWNDTLAKTARAHSEDMASRGFFDHTNPDGYDPFDRMRNAGILYYTAAENIAAGQAEPEDVMESWMNSPGHRANILNPDLRELGVGMARGGSYGIYWTQNFATTR